jgi:hypothetical protein
MSLPIITRRALVGLLAVVGLVVMVLTAPPPVEAQEREVVCVSWRSTGYTTTDEKGEELYVIEARCTGWMDFGTGVSVTVPPKDDGTGGGLNGELGRGDKALCDYLKREAGRLRQQIATAQQRIGQARADLASYAAKAGTDYAEVQRTRAELDQARREYDDAKRYYEANNDTEVERELRSGVVVAVQLGINPWGVGARELQEASDGLARAQQNHARAWDQWRLQSDPDFQAAQRLVDYYTDLVDNGPMQLEDLQREINGSCP